MSGEGLKVEKVAKWATLKHILLWWEKIQNRVALTARVVFEGDVYCGASSGTEALMYQI